MSKVVKNFKFYLLAILSYSNLDKEYSYIKKTKSLAWN